MLYVRPSSWCGKMNAMSNEVCVREALSQGRLVRSAGISLLKKVCCLIYFYRFAIHRNAMQHETINQRELLKGTLGTIILQLLSDNKKLYGYEITQLVKVKSNSAVLIKEGSLYPALHKLEADGFIKSEEVYIGKRVRKYYSVTPPGKKYTKAAIQELQSFIETMQSLLIPNLPNNVPA